MLALRPNCECCDKDLPPDATDAMICTYECTFCTTCVHDVLHNVCPNCGGGLAPRPIRPNTEHRKGLSTAHHPPSKERINTPYSREDITAFVAKLKDIPPEQR